MASDSSFNFLSLAYLRLSYFAVLVFHLYVNVAQSSPLVPELRNSTQRWRVKELASFNIVPFDSEP